MAIADSSCFEGAYVLAALLHPEEWLNKEMRVVTEFTSAREMAKAFSDVSGKPVHVAEIDTNAFDAMLNNPLPEELHAK